MLMFACLTQEGGKMLHLKVEYELYLSKGVTLQELCTSYMYMHEQTEKYIIEQILKGDKQGFRWIIEKYQDMVYTLCVRMMGREEHAQEVAQDVFMKVYKNLSRYEGRSKFSTWIYRIAYNECISNIRKQTRIIDIVDEIPDVDIDAGALDGFTMLQAQERRRYLQEAIDVLGESDAVVISLFYLEELSLEEIAEVTGMQNNAIRTRLHRARKKLLEALSIQLKTELKSIL